MPTAEAKLDTPLMRQYQALKSSYPHAILFFRLGDFYEMFGDDAKAASPILGLVLTARQGIPMCGIPAHSVQNYLAKLLKAGHKVAVADQMEDPAQAKGIVKRQVTRLVTPGTVVEDELLDASSTNYLVAVELDTVGWGLACVEVSTGEFWATQMLNDSGYRRLLSLLARLDPAEVLATPEAAETLRLHSTLRPRAAITGFALGNSIRPRERHPRTAVPEGRCRGRGQLSPGDVSGGEGVSKFDVASASERISAEPWSATPAWRNRHLAVRAALKARAYVAETGFSTANVLVPIYREAHEEMQIDETAIRTLELVVSSVGDRRHSLWGTLDRCRTSMGSRKLKKWILHPLIQTAEIELRQNAVEELLERTESRRTLGQILSEITDLERVVSRLATQSASPRDLGALRDSLLQLEAFRRWLTEAPPGSALSTFIPVLDETAGPLEKIRGLLEQALADRPSPRISDGGIIRAGCDSKLDELRSIKSDSQKYLAELESRERRMTGISSLKVGYTSVFGYYLEVTRTHLSKTPPRYTRKQTLANAERFITSELKELETKILGAEDKILRLEAELFESVRSQVVQAHGTLLKLASLVSEIDVLASLAEAAHLNDYVKPKVNLSYDLTIEDGRHPMVERALQAGSFVSNSTSLDGTDPQILILTGPNMGGKSTYLRQNALIALMAQIGSFVPARSAVIGIVDKILTRIGSQDALARNESTFMVEMRETAHILEAATPRSLLILDEVGRGTSTFDGISIAWAILEYLNTAYRPTESSAPGAPRGPRVLFATHYFELTELAELFPGARNANVEAREWTNADGRTEVVFLHKIAQGPADRSFGLHVARLAGIPETCLERARKILAGLENKAPLPHISGRNSARGETPDARPAPIAQELPIFEDHPVLRELKLLNPEKITPLEALERLSKWKKSI